MPDGRHRRPAPPSSEPPEPEAPETGGQPHPADERVRRRHALALALTNAVTAAAFLLFNPGAAPSLEFLARVVPLPVWGAALAVAAGLLVAGMYRAGHTVAVVCWAMWASGALYGLALGTTRSPAVSVALTGLLVGLSALHINSLTARIRERRT